MLKRTATSKPGNTFRVIAGQWRGRRLEFPDVKGIRPTPDRVKETLFNWLAPIIPGAVCLDLFAGSGSLGLEALSRGAKEVVFVDQSKRVCAGIESNLQRLDASARAVVHPDTAMQYLKRCDQAYDVVFLDPPFGQGLLAEVLSCLETGHLLTANALVYAESEQPLTELSAFWQLTRSKRASKVAYHLLQRENSSTQTGEAES